MQAQRIFTSGALCLTVALFTGAALAQSPSTMDQTAIQDDEAAAVADDAAALREEGSAMRQEKEATQAEQFHSEEVSGDLNPVDEGDQAQIKEPHE